jgi:hypothetical protein
LASSLELESGAGSEFDFFMNLHTLALWQPDNCAGFRAFCDARPDATGPKYNCLIWLLPGKNGTVNQKQELARGLFPAVLRSVTKGL